ncbi:MAG: thiamine pyrophosphate-dependent enzyme [Melioribacter sp.]|uniref:thiamine pyrophosphate-dependent enzyme n=1 Tax=Rosettibacter primus TaxID=3111523 RepID=UPI00247C29C6|nr:thiamine pyrophosphate-dependent enzyme [Melioribacter sp.]
MKATIYQAIAHALNDLGVEIVTFVPGYGASETFQFYNELTMRSLKMSFHEEVAYTISHGASILGKRAAVLMKAHGLMKAANSVSDSLYTELTAGFVTIIFDDKSGKHSDNILEIAPILEGMSMPFITSRNETVYDDIVNAFFESERKKMPVAVIVDALNTKLEIEFTPKQNLKRNFSYERNIYSHVVSPLLADYQYKLFIAKKLNGNLETVVRPELPFVPDSLTEKAKEGALQYIPFFNVFKNIKRDIATGDTGSSSSFAFPPYNSIDIVTYMGGSIPLAIGAYLAGKKNVWALTGDFSFISAGNLGLLGAFNREIPLKVVIFYNKKAAATGNQPIHRKLLRHILAGYEKYLLSISNPDDPFEIDAVLHEALSSNEMKIIIVDY